MGYNICGIIINSLPNFSDNEKFDKKKLKTKFSKTKIKRLSPKDLSIGFKDNNTLIFLDMIFYQNISEEKDLTDLERDLNSIFPNSRILIVVINDTVNFTGYSLIENGIKTRTKAVVNDQIFIDFGELYGKEIEMYERAKNIFNDYPELVQKIENLYVEKPEIEKKKGYIKRRDLLLKKINAENFDNYTDGSLDSLIIETELKKMLNCDFNEIESLDFFEFERRKLNFKKDSLKEYLFLATNSI